MKKKIPLISLLIPTFLSRKHTQRDSKEKLDYLINFFANYYYLLMNEIETPSFLNHLTSNRLPTVNFL